MLDSTMYVIKEIINEFKKIAYIIGIFLQVIFLGFSIYTIFDYFLHNAAIYLKICYVFLTALNLFLLIFKLVITDFKTYTLKNKIYNKFKKSVKIFKRLFSLFKIIMIILSIFTSSQKPNLTNLLLTTLSIVFYVLQVILDIITSVLGKKFADLKDAFIADKSVMLKPINTIKSFFGKKSDPLTENQLNLIEKGKEYKKERKQLKKERKQQEKLNKLNEKNKVEEPTKEKKKNKKVAN